jgi:hypothetical protein
MKNCFLFICGYGTGRGGRLFGGVELMLAVDEAVLEKENVELARFAVS